MEKNEIANTIIKDSKDLIVKQDIDGMKKAFHHMKQFAQLVKQDMEPNVDYGVIIKGEKPTLLKPGMEKILLAYGLYAELEQLAERIDMPEKFVFYKFKATLKTANGTIVSVGLGSCNNREKAKLGMNFYDAINSVMKIAIKRAKMDATLGLGAFSGVFTQDMDDNLVNKGEVKEVAKTFTTTASKNHMLIFYGECYKYFFGRTGKFEPKEKEQVKPIIAATIEKFKKDFNQPDFSIHKSRTHSDLDNLFNIFKELAEVEKMKDPTNEK